MIRFSIELLERRAQGFVKPVLDEARRQPRYIVEAVVGQHKTDYDKIWKQWLRFMKDLTLVLCLGLVR